MSFLAPIALTLLAALPASILLSYLLRGRRRRVPVPALFLWANLPPGTSGRGRWQRPPLSLLLLLQLAIAVLLAFALARPATSSGPPPRQLALVLDASASMQATDVAPTRFSAARDAAIARLDTTRRTDQIAVIWAGSSARLLVNGSPDQARMALAEAEPGAGGDSLHQAIAMAARQIAREPDRDGQILVFTDGAFDPLPPVGALAVPVEFVSVGPSAGGGGASNQAIVSVQVRTDGSPSAGREVFVELANYAARPVRVPLRLTAAESGRQIESRDIDLAARGTAQVAVRLPSDVTRLSVQLGSSGDALPVDDRAEVVVPGLGSQPRPVTLVSDSPAAMQRALQAIPAVRLTTVSRADYSAGNQASMTPASLTVLDGVLPAELPGGPLLIVNPPTDSGHLRVTDAPRSGSTLLVDAAHPLLMGLDSAAFRFEQQHSFEVPLWGRSVVATARGPLVLEGHREGRPVVTLAFDPAGSGFDKSIAFPLLVSNVVSHLLAEGAGPSIPAGQVVALPVPRSGSAVLIRPDGRRETLTPIENEIRVVNTDQAGRYSVRDAENEQVVLRSFSVNLLDIEESDIEPRADLTTIPATTLFASAEAEGAESPMSEWWTWLVGAAVLLVGEWLLFARRGS